MPKSETSQAPQERVQIVYRSQTGDAQEETELPLKILMVGDYQGQKHSSKDADPDATPNRIEDRMAAPIDKDSFNQVLAEHQVQTQFQVPNQIDGSDKPLSISLAFKHIDDFSPMGIAEQVPALRQLLDLRDALNALKGPIGNRPGFRRALSAALLSAAQDPAAAQK